MGILIWLLIPWQFVGCVTYKIPLVYSGGGVTSRVFENLETRVKVLREISLRGKPGQGYYISVNIGNPPQMVMIVMTESFFVTENMTLNA